VTVPRPHVLLSVATSIDGCIDDTSPERLHLSNAEDFDRVDQVRADSDAILVGAGTIRADNPRLVVESETRRAARLASGEPEHPLKVTVSAGGTLDPGLKFWHHGGKKIVYTTDTGAPRLGEQLDGLADVVPLGGSAPLGGSLGPGGWVDLGALLDDLGRRGVRRLMVEGGSSVHTAFLCAGLVDEIHLAIAPIVVGAAAAPRFLNPASYPWPPTRRMRLVETRALGDTVLLRYAPKDEGGG